MSSTLLFSMYYLFNHYNLASQWNEDLWLSCSCLLILGNAPTVFLHNITWRCLWKLFAVSIFACPLATSERCKYGHMTMSGPFLGFWNWNREVSVFLSLITESLMCKCRRCWQVYLSYIWGAKAAEMPEESKKATRRKEKPQSLD